MNAPLPPSSTHEAITRVVAYFERLQPSDLANLGLYYASDARFKDPFNEVQGLAAIEGIFRHMFASLQHPHFVITGCVEQGSHCFLTWEFRFAFQGYARGVEQTVRGATHLVLDGQHRITLHRDYWDAAEELYEKLPGVGALMRWLKRRARG